MQTETEPWIVGVMDEYPTYFTKVDFHGKQIMVFIGSVSDLPKIGLINKYFHIVYQILYSSI